MMNNIYPKPHNQSKQTWLRGLSRAHTRLTDPRRYTSRMATGSFWDFQDRLRNKNAPPADSAAPLTVSQLTSKIEKALRSGLPTSLLVRGEVSNFKLHSASGHAYFTLKDPAACIDCVMFRDDAANLRFMPADGLEVVATGRIGVFAQRGRYQLYVASLVPVGQGALELARRQIETKLRAQGLFNPERKKTLPRYPRRIAIVTGETTAALQDMLKVLGRFPFITTSLVPVPVQGDGSAEKIAEALRRLSARPDGTELILLGRGGGSLEDLWEFNEEIVARAIADSKVPIITGIGHEIDVSIADLVADYHAHTPTEAAQVATRHWRNAPDLIEGICDRLAREMRQLIGDAQQRLRHIQRHEMFRRPLDHLHKRRQLLDDRQRAMTLTVARRLREVNSRLARLHSRLIQHHPRHAIALYIQQFKASEKRLARGALQSLHAQNRRLDLLATRLRCINPQEILKRGYSMTLVKKSGAIVRSPSQVKPGDTLLTRLADGQIESVVEDTQQLKLFET